MYYRMSNFRIHVDKNVNDLSANILRTDGMVISRVPGVMVPISGQDVVYPYTLGGIAQTEDAPGTAGTVISTVQLGSVGLNDNSIVLISNVGALTNPGVLYVSGRAYNPDRFYVSSTGNQTSIQFSWIVLP